MYVTRPLSLYKQSPSALSDPPPEGPGSGILVVQDAEAQPKCCFGLAKSDKIRHLPIPQNKSLEIYYSQGYARDRDLHFHSVWFIPVLGLPLSANRYYAVHPLGKDRGEAFVCAKEDELEAFCCYVYAPETQPQPFDPNSVYQQMEITLHGRKLTPWGSDFELKSTAPDGFAPGFLGRREGWKLYVTCEAPEFELGQALGLDGPLRERLPDFDFSLDCEKSKPVVVGKWYSPFVFVREGTPRTMMDQRRTSMFYEMTLEQRWERIHHCENDGSGRKSLVFDRAVRTEVALVGGREAVVDEKDLDEGLLWFTSENNYGEASSIGLNMVIVERMRWEEERVGFVFGKEKEVRVEKREEYGGVGEWKRFGAYILVESFVLKRMDGSVAITHEFRHSHRIRTKWE